MTIVLPRQVIESCSGEQTYKLSSHKGNIYFFDILFLLGLGVAPYKGSSTKFRSFLIYEMTVS